MKGDFILLFVGLFVLGNGQTEGHSHELERVKRAAVEKTKDFFWHYEKVAIIKKHNEKRRIPNASNMEIMYWDYTLEKIAQNYANKCIYRHNIDRTGDQEKFARVGENLFYTTGTSWATDVFVNMWYDEVSDYSFADNSCPAGKSCGHYTQIVWATSYAVGCGMKFCPTAQGYSGKTYNNIFLVVCNYGPAGNYVGTKPYTEGNSCSSCPTAKTTCDDGLCSVANCGGKTCQNGGKLVTDVCLCDCRNTGYEGDLCEIVPNIGCSLKTFDLFLMLSVCFVSLYFALS